MSTGLKVSLACPGCGESGLVDWRNLKNGIGCPKCGCQFLIGRNGRVLSQSELPHVRFTCPRCKHSGSIPKQLVERGTKCVACELPLALGPDQRLHGVKEAEDLWRAAEITSRRASITDQLVATFTTRDGRVRAPFAVGSIAAFGLLIVVAGVMAKSIFDHSPETAARRFVVTCLSGDWAAAQAYVEDDAVQQASFERWRVRYFPSILDTHRPKGDKVDVAAKLVEDRGASRVFLITMRSPFIGSRSHVQHWHQRDGNWLFDARGTLTREIGAGKNQRKRGGTRSASYSEPAQVKRAPGRGL